MPPIDGLQLIWPKVSSECVSSKVDTPMRADASAASVPAWPPPMTMTSKRLGYSMAELEGQPAIVFFPRPLRRQDAAVAGRNISVWSMPSSTYGAPAMTKPRLS